MEIITPQLLIDKFKIIATSVSYESSEIELDNLDQARLVFDKHNNVVVENKHGTQFPVSYLSKKELIIFYRNI